MTGHEAITEALRDVADPCCKERGISVVDMGLVHAITVDGGSAAIDILLTSGWCPFQVDLIGAITDAVEALPEVETASVRIVLDDVWSTERMAPEARTKLQFLPAPVDVGDRDAYVAARPLPLLQLSARPLQQSTTGEPHDR
jgi:metal-sulfur cluster biosynthetic enzyme